jgi:xanthine/uracil permease
MIVFAIIGTIGIDILRKVDLHVRSNMIILAAALTMGLLPIVVPGLYSRFPATLQLVIGNGLAMGAITAIVLNIVFHHVGAAAHGDAAPAQEPAAPAPTADETRTAPAA